ncbi:MAG: TOBE domain-containing protein [Solirubrobacteraceae bacterium]
MSDRILVIDHGQVQQIATPEDVYRRPANRFVASFLGRCNLLPGVVHARRTDGSLEIVPVGERRALLAAAADVPIGAEVTIAIRPESIRLIEAANGRPVDRANCLEVAVKEVSFLGDHYEYTLAAGAIELFAQSQERFSAPALTAVIEPSACAVLLGDGRRAGEVASEFVGVGATD